MKGINNYEYYINYPEVNLQVDSLNDFVVEEKKPPLVIIFGWSGSIHKHLKVYSNMYNEKGLVTLSCICPVDIIFWRQKKLLEIVENILENLEEVQASERSIFIHLFSNGGCVQYDFFRKAVTKNFQIKGVIFDSAPGRTTFQNTWLAFVGIYGFPFGMFSIPLNFFIVCLFYTLFLIKKFCHKFSKDMYVLEMVDNLKDENNTFPQHFIYSKTDQLIPYKDIQYFMAHRKSKGVDVSSTFFEDAPHVRHFQKNKPSYSRSVFNFLRKCLRK